MKVLQVINNTVVEDIQEQSNILEVKYSLDEKKVGKWVDGSDIYQITLIHPGPTAVNVVKYVDISHLNIKMIVENSCSMYWKTSKNTAFLDYMNASVMAYHIFYGFNRIGYVVTLSNWTNAEIIHTIKYIKKKP